MSSTLTVNNLTKKFGSFTAVDNISFDLKEGEILGLLGPNGAGKTTTIQMLLRVLTPTKGEIKYFDKDFFLNRQDCLEKINYTSAFNTLQGRTTIFRFGTRIQALAWGLITMFQPLMAVIYPVSVLPKSLQTVAYLFPPTYIFEAARANISDPTTQWNSIGMAFLLNFIFIFLAVTFFNFMFDQSKKTGQFARLEG